MPLQHCPSVYEFHDVLRACPHLSKLTLDAAGPKLAFDDVVNINLSPIDLPCLATLFLGDFTALYAIYVLNSFHAKNLIDLTIFNMVRCDYGPLVEHLTGQFPDV